MDLRRLQIFLGVADHGGFTRAARAMHVSQPALSQAVRELEAELQVALFDRLGRRVRLTAAGHALAGPARQVLRDIDTARAAVLAVNELEAGQLELCSLPTLAAHPVAGLIGQFRARHPGVQVVLADADDAGELVDMVRSGTSEVGISEKVTVPPQLATRRLVVQDLVAVLPPGSRSSGSPLSLARLNEQALIAGPPGTSSRRLLEEAFAEAGLQARIAVVAEQREAIVSLVMAGAGAALLPSPIAETAAKLGATVRRVTPRVRREVVAIHRSGPLSPAASRFLALALG